VDQAARREACSGNVSPGVVDRRIIGRSRSEAPQTRELLPQRRRLHAVESDWPAP